MLALSTTRHTGGPGREPGSAATATSAGPSTTSRSVDGPDGPDGPLRTGPEASPPVSAGCPPDAPTPVGCGAAAEVSGTSIVVDGTTYTVGTEGDVVTVGDWDCDGRSTPGVLRPSTGEVFLFTDWATTHRPVAAERRAVVPDAHLLSPAPMGCGPPVVERTSGRPVTLPSGATDAGDGR